MHLVLEDQKTGKRITLCYDRHSGVVRVLDYTTLGDIQTLTNTARSLGAPAVQAIVEMDNVKGLESLGWKVSKGLVVMEVDL